MSGISTKMLQAAAGVPKGGWDVSTASFSQSFSVSAQDGRPQGLFFKPDGTKMYFTGRDGVDVNEYDLSSAWDISTASFSQRFSVSARESEPQGLFFKPDGTKMYITGTQGVDVTEYNLSSAWDISTASFSQNFSVSAQDSSPQGVFFKPDGAKMYIAANSNDNVYEYDLSSAWDVSTASFSQSFSVSAQDASPTGIFFKPDGAKMYVLGSSADNVNEYDLSGSWDISTASFLQSFSVSAQDSSPQDIFFRFDGIKMYILGTGGDNVNEYDL